MAEVKATTTAEADVGETTVGEAVLEAAEAAATPGVRVADQRLRTSLQLVFLVLLGVGASAMIIVLLWPFLPAIVTSAVLAVLVYPAYRHLERWLRHRSLAAFVGTAIVFFLLLLPAIGVTFMIVDQIRGGIGLAATQAMAFIAPDGLLAGWIDELAERFGYDSGRLMQALDQQIQSLARVLADRTLGFLSGVGGLALQAGAALFTLYYLLRDADGVVRGIKRFVPLEGERTDLLLDRAREVTFATVYGNIVVALVQGALGGLGFLVVGLPSPALWGSVMALMSLLPVVGPTFVWGPAVVILFAGGHIARALVLLGIGALVVSTVDNVLRAVLVSDRTQLHPLIVFFSVLGGIFVFGAVGILVGPVVFVVALTLVAMARAALGIDEVA